MRGGILDVFPFIGENPIRIEFWGNAVESIREFDVLSQRSIARLEAASIVPDPARKLNEAGETAPEASGSLFDYLPENVVILLDDPVLMENAINELAEEGKQNMFDWDFIGRKFLERSCVASASFASVPLFEGLAKTPQRIDF